MNLIPSLKNAELIANEYNISIIRPKYFAAESSCENEDDGYKEAWKKCRFLWDYAILGIDGIEPCGSYNKKIEF